METDKPAAEVWGAEFRSWRERHGLSLNGTSALLGVSRKAIKEWSGRRTPEAWKAIRLAMSAVDLDPSLAQGANPTQRRRQPGEMTYKPRADSV